jgi:hypothetical protein
MTTTEEYADEHGISPRRVRALAAAGRIPAHRVGTAWVIEDGARHEASHAPRPMGARMRQLLLRALRDQSLVGLTGPDRIRVARHLGALRAADEPAALLRAWFRDDVPTGWTPGELIVRQAHEGRDDRVAALVRRPRRTFASTPERLARAIVDERSIRQLSRDELAVRAGVAADVVADLERGRPGVGIGATRSVLRALDVEPLALPPVTTEAGR